MAGGDAAAALRIRMYNVGFGDCFLLFVPTSAGERTLLLDCGKHMSSKTGRSVSDAARDIVATVSRDGRARLDVVVATHRHYDHISGYALNLWNDVEVGEVWMPWTEEVGNPAADAIRHSQNRIAMALAQRFASADTPVGALALNSLSNKDAEKRLRTGFAGQPRRRYLPSDGEGAQMFTTDALPGVRVHVLGPSHDRDVIALMDPPAGMYFPDDPVKPGEAAAPATPEDTTVAVAFPHLFGPQYRWDGASFGARYATLAEHTDAAALDGRSTVDMLAAAAGLEDAINGTSLVFALEFGDDCVLFAGDAEWGTWSKILDDPVRRQLLARTCAYKVSHHGSYNGTPKPFVDDVLPADALSLVSLGPMQRWPSIPRASLLTALGGQQRRLVRSDEVPPDAADVTRDGDLWIEIAIPVG